MSYHFETLQLHVGQEQPDPATGARAVPIYQTTSYVFRDCAQAAARFGLTDVGNIYGRLTNSTQDVLEQRVAALEGGVAALATASGAAAVTYTIQALARQGDHIVAQKTIYGGTYNLLAHTLPQYGITATFVDAHDAAAVEEAIQPNTRAVYLETLGNPNCDIPNIEAIAAVAHRHGLPLVIDNTFGTPYWVKVIPLGADIVVHSATKFLGGHGTTLGGIIVDAGTFDWAASGSYPQLAAPNPSYHGISFVQAAGKAAFVTYVRAILLRDTGCRTTRTTRCIRSTSRTAAAPSSPLRSRAARPRRTASSTTCRSSPCWPTSRTSRASLSTRPRRRTPSSRRRSCSIRASARTPSACPSARSMPMTSSPTSRRASPPQRADRKENGALRDPQRAGFYAVWAI